jgi:hypothetical protein
MTSLRIVFCAAMLAVASAAMAQTRPGDMVVDVPFAFMVDGQTFPAGHYIVAVASESRIRIFNAKTAGAYVSTHNASRTAGDGSKLVFHRYGDTFFLAAMWTTGNSTGRELAPSRAEREAAAHELEMQLAVVRPQTGGQPSK